MTPQRQRDFWRWTAGIGWSLNLLLVAWAIFLRDIGLVEKQGAAGERAQPAATSGGQDFKLDDAAYEAFLERGLDEGRSIAETDGKLGRLLGEISLDLKQLRGQRQPSDEDAGLARFVEDLEAKVERNKQLLERRDKVLYKDMSGELERLRSLDERLLKQKTVPESRGAATLQPQPPAPWSVSADVVEVVQGSALPVGFFLAVSLLVTWLSQQFLRVANTWRRSRWSKAKRMRAVQLRRLQGFQDTAGHALDELAQGHLSEARRDFDDLAASLGKWAAEPTWEEVARLEASAFWERWGPQAFELEAVLPGVQEAPKETSRQAEWVVERWCSSAQAVVKDTVEGALASWAQAGKKPDESEAADSKASASTSFSSGSGLVIRIFGRWPGPGEWVNFANLPLAGDWREKALRLLLPAEKDVKDLPVLGPLCESALTAIVETQVRRSLSNNVWGGLTMDLWRLGGRVGSQRPFQIGYEVVEVQSQEPTEMRAIALSLPRSGTPGRVVPVRAGLEPHEEGK